MAGRVRPLAVFSGYFRVSDATLHTYAYQTDPQGDLDQDGIPNRTELENGTNPFVAGGPPFSVAITYPPSMAGGWLTVDDVIPGEAGYPYFGPFTSSSERSSVGGRLLPISLLDPLLPYSTMTGLSWLTGTQGIVPATGQASVSLLLPPGIATGTRLFHTVGTADPGGTLRFVSPSYELTL